MASFKALDACSLVGILAWADGACWERNVYVLLTLLLEGNIMVQQVLTQCEYVLLRPLLEAYPSPCSYERLYTTLIELSEEQAHVFVEGACKGEVSALALQLVRTVLGYCRVKLEACNLAIREVDGAMACEVFRLWEMRRA